MSPPPCHGYGFQCQVLVHKVHEFGLLLARMADEDVRLARHHCPNEVLVLLQGDQGMENRTYPTSGLTE